MKTRQKLEINFGYQAPTNAPLPVRLNCDTKRRNNRLWSPYTWTLRYDGAINILLECVIMIVFGTHTHMPQKKKPVERNVLVENDTFTRKQEANEKNDPCRSSKNVFETDSECSKKIDSGKMLQAGWRDGRQPGCPLSLGNGPRPLPKPENSE